MRMQMQWRRSAIRVRHVRLRVSAAAHPRNLARARRAGAAPRRVSAGTASSNEALCTAAAGVCAIVRPRQRFTDAGARERERATRGRCAISREDIARANSRPRSHQSVADRCVRAAFPARIAPEYAPLVPAGCTSTQAKVSKSKSSKPRLRRRAWSSLA